MQPSLNISLGCKVCGGRPVPGRPWKETCLRATVSVLWLACGFRTLITPVFLLHFTTRDLPQHCPLFMCAMLMHPQTHACLSQSVSHVQAACRLHIACRQCPSSICAALMPACPQLSACAGGDAYVMGDAQATLRLGVTRTRTASKPRRRSHGHSPAPRAGSAPFGARTPHVQLGFNEMGQPLLMPAPTPLPGPHGHTLPGLPGHSPLPAPLGLTLLGRPYQGLFLPMRQCAAQLQDQGGLEGSASLPMDLSLRGTVSAGVGVG